MLQSGIIHPSSSCWSSPLHMVPKKTPGDWQSCGVYSALNSQMVPNRYPLPHIQDFSFSLHSAKIFSKIDLTRAYHQIPVEADDMAQDSHHHTLRPPMSLCESPSASGMPHNHFRDSWIRSYVVSTSPFTTWTTCWW